MTDAPSAGAGLRLTDEAALSSCVACGLCLPHCPTWRVTGDEAASPRGRIATMVQIQREGAPVDDRAVDAFESCIQCRGCEPACPSGVPFGAMIADTRQVLSGSPGRPLRAPWWLRVGLRVLDHPRLLRIGTSALAIAQRARLVPGRVPVPGALPVRPVPLRLPAPAQPSGERVVLHVGCVMDAWQRNVHQAALDVLAAVGVEAIVPADRPCCGALHHHAGIEHRRHITRTVRAHDIDDLPVLVDSAGCGAAMQEYGDHDAAAAAFAARVVDVHHYIAERAHRLPPLRPQGVVVVQDPCHLRHVQRDHEAVAALLSRCADVRLLDDDGLCCGAGGAYALQQPGLARAVRDRKLAAIDRAAGSDPAQVASANPGCLVHLGVGDRPVRHPMEILAAALTEP